MRQFSTPVDCANIHINDKMVMWIDNLVSLKNSNNRKDRKMKSDKEIYTLTGFAMIDRTPVYLDQIKVTLDDKSEIETGFKILPESIDRVNKSINLKGVSRIEIEHVKELLWHDFEGVVYIETELIETPHTGTHINILEE